MTMVYCSDCGKDVHITSECVKGDHSVSTPPELRGPPEPEVEEEARE